MKDNDANCESSPQNNQAFVFRKISYSDGPLIHRWFNSPHVQAFYSLRHWSDYEVFEKINPMITNEKPLFGFIALNHNNPIGYIQYYCIKDYPWPEQDLTEAVIEVAAGLDCFIGEPKFIGQGFGPKIIKQFLDEKIWPKFQYCIVDPHTENSAAIRCYEKLGFHEHKIINAKDALNRDVTLKLMILERNKP